jgi:hypothetical protein
MSSFLQNTLFIGGFILIAGIGYFLYTHNAPLRTQDADVSQQIAAQSEDFLKRLNELKAIRLSGDIFADPRFTTLSHYSQPVSPTPIGRTNPFDTTNQ